MDVLNRLFEERFHSPVTQAQPLDAHLSGSERKLMRLTSGEVRAIGARYNVREENVAFLEFSTHFRRHGLPVPGIYTEDFYHDAYLAEDLAHTPPLELF